MFGLTAFFDAFEEHSCGDVVRAAVSAFDDLLFVRIVPARIVAVDFFHIFGLGPAVVAEHDLAAHLAGQIKVVNDSELLVPAAGFENGIGVVSGTGSIAVARSHSGEMLVAGGWGWILGDEGSAAALVREAARAVRGSIDLGQSGDPLIEHLMNRLDTKDPTKIGRMLNDVRGAAIWGSYAGAVFDAAAQNSDLAIKVISDGAGALARLVGILVNRGADARHVVIGGGVVVEQPMLFNAFCAAMADISPVSEVTLLRAPPVNGALALAERLIA
jgi:N-acetylglucosamine kinase-like BadF-type ATPase